MPPCETNRGVEVGGGRGEKPPCPETQRLYQNGNSVRNSQRGWAPRRAKERMVRGAVEFVTVGQIRVVDRFDISSGIHSVASMGQTAANQLPQNTALQKPVLILLPAVLRPLVVLGRYSAGLFSIKFFTYAAKLRRPLLSTPRHGTSPSAQKIAPKFKAANSMSASHFRRPFHCLRAFCGAT